MALQTCFHPDCSNLIDTDNSHRFGVGISHYGNDGKSYLQVHTTMHSCSRQCALEAAHARLDSHKDMTHGKFEKEKHNPDGNEYPDSLVRMAAEYHFHPRGTASLPAICGTCGKSLNGNIYVPHVDDSTRGTCYQEILQKRDSEPKSLETYDLGACSNEHAIILAHHILDHIIEPDSKGEEIVMPDGTLAPNEDTIQTPVVSRRSSK